MLFLSAPEKETLFHYSLKQKKPDLSSVDKGPGRHLLSHIIPYRPAPEYKKILMEIAAPHLTKPFSPPSFVTWLHTKVFPFAIINSKLELRNQKANRKYEK